MTNKYVKLTSVTWWSAMSSFSAGMFIAFEPVHHLTELAVSISTVYGDTAPGLLINLGLAGIGIRGALK